MLGSYQGFHMSRKREQMIVRHMAGSKDLSSSFNQGSETEEESALSF